MAAKAKADLEAGRIPAFKIDGTCEVLPSEALVAQSLGVTPLASLPVNSDSLAVPPCSTVQTDVDISQPLLPCAPSLTPLTRSASELSSESSLPKRRRTSQWPLSHVDPVMPLCYTAPQHKATLISLIGGVGVSLCNLDRLSVSELLFFD
ncbi:hypothetical protein AALP_AA7G109700 [Arabis alpina]|uniref:Uncharacterized protein n=1 Tax=Arabis alpina TaxID=50452 RepID=A0A087GHA6_ARAAL|nr:hypothetical protein AALP_AA7G109700 [Arabis alpina]